MLWATASSLLILLIAALPLYFLIRRLHAAFVLMRELEDTLAIMETLADPTALANPKPLAHIAANLPPQTTALAADIFEQDEKALSVSRLSHQGLKPPDIAHRLSLPLGEVELLLSLRPAS